MKVCFAARLFLTMFSATAVVGRPGGGVKGVCEDFVVSPKPIVFTEHPRGTVANIGDEVHLRCTANVEQIGGFQIVSKTNPKYGKKDTWRHYSICWMYQPLDERETMEYCSSRDDLTISSSSTGGDEMVSELKFLNASVASSGFYSCYIEDWRTRYSSYPAYVQVYPDGSSSQRVRTSLIVPIPMGDMAEVNCGLPLNDSDSLTWFHNGRKLTVPSDRYSSTSLGALRFKVLSVEDKGTYECVSSLGESHFVGLIITGTVTGSTRPSRHTVYQGASGSNVTLTLDCQKDPHNAMDDVWYEWYINGTRSNRHSSSVEAVDIQSYVCYTHYASKTESLSVVYRVLPHGCVNPVVGLEYPTVDVEVHNTTEKITLKVKFCWNKPDHLGGLNEDEIGYRIVFKNLDTPTSPLENVTLNSLCYEGMFTTMSEITTRIDIEVSAVPNTMDQTEPSRATVFPKTSLIGWTSLDTKDYCHKERMRILVKDPLYPWVANQEKDYHVVFLCRQNKTTREYLETTERLTFEYALSYAYYRSSRDIKHEIFFVDEKGTNSIILMINAQQKEIEALFAGGWETVYPDTHRSCALVVYRTLNDGKLFPPHKSSLDYSICHFQDPPKVAFVTDKLKVERGKEITIEFVIADSGDQRAKSDFNLNLNTRAPDTGKPYVWSSGLVAKEAKRGAFNFPLPDSLDQDKLSFFTFTLSIPEQYDNIVELGNITIVRLEITEPVPVKGNVSSNLTSPEENQHKDQNGEIVAEVVGSVFLLGCLVALLSSCFTVCLRARARQLQRNATVRESLTLNTSADFWTSSMNLDEDRVTQYDGEPDEDNNTPTSHRHSCSDKSNTTEATSHDSAFFDDGGTSRNTNEVHFTDMLSMGDLREPSLRDASKRYIALSLPDIGTPSPQLRKIAPPRVLPIKTTGI